MFRGLGVLGVLVEIGETVSKALSYTFQFL